MSILQTHLLVIFTPNRETKSIQGIRLLVALRRGRKNKGKDMEFFVMIDLLKRQIEEV